MSNFAPARRRVRLPPVRTTLLLVASNAVMIVARAALCVVAAVYFMFRAQRA